MGKTARLVFVILFMFIVISILSGIARGVLGWSLLEARASIIEIILLVIAVVVCNWYAEWKEKNKG